MPREFLIFRLWAPMASWGDIAVGERRGSWARPSRSAILGLVAAALGIERTNAAAHTELEESLGFAARVDDSGRPLRDYHTAQSPSSKRGARWATRREELDPGNELNTILSERQYYLETDAVIALWIRNGRHLSPTLPDIARALAEPVFTLYLGRKACPLGLPMTPYIFSTETPLSAFAVYDAAEVASLEVEKNEKSKARGPKRWLADNLRRGRREDRSAPLDIWLAEDDAQAFGLPRPYAEQTSRRDGVRDRGRWLFSDRVEVRVSAPQVAAASTVEPEAGQ